jgi:hypothetical protein
MSDRSEDRVLAFTPARTFTQAEVDALIERRLSKQRRIHERQVAMLRSQLQAAEITIGGLREKLITVKMERRLTAFGSTRQTHSRARLQTIQRRTNIIATLTLERRRLLRDLHEAEGPKGQTRVAREVRSRLGDVESQIEHACAQVEV